MIGGSDYVVFDFETNADRPHAADHEIIQIGAVGERFDGSGIDEFGTLVRPERKLAPHITDLTGLEYGDLGNAPPLKQALAEFFDRVDNRAMIAQNGFGYDFIVMDAAAARLGLTVPNGPRLDTLQLAHIVHPRAGEGMVCNIDGTRPLSGRSLDHLASLIGLEPRAKHDALNDARITRDVMQAMLDELNQDTPVRRLQRWVLGCVGHPWAAFVSPQPAPVPLEDVIPETPAAEPIVPTGSFDVSAIVESFGEGGKLMTLGRKPRPQQGEMAELVAKSFASAEKGRRTMIEAPTGTGKTLAYLVPAIEAARASGRTSVVVPHSRVLQDQILGTLEDLKSQVGPFSTVVLKGRQNYISLTALEAELAWLSHETADTAAADAAAAEADAVDAAVDADDADNADVVDAAVDAAAADNADAAAADADDAGADAVDAADAADAADTDAVSDHATGLALAIICGWVSQTPTGDWADLRTHAVDPVLPVLRLLRWKLRVETRPGPATRRLDELEFYRRALDKLRTAHVAVLNHALLASGSVMHTGEFNLLIDEAHDLEDSATSAATYEVSLQRLEMLCDALWDPATRSGLVARIAAATGAGHTAPHIVQVRDACMRARSAIAGLSEPLVEYVRDRTGVTREQAARYGASHRIMRGVDRRHATYRAAQDAGRSLRDALRDVAAALDDINVPAVLRGRYRRNALEEETARLGRKARDAAALADAVLWAEAQLSLLDYDSDDESMEWINVAEVRFESFTSTDEAKFGNARVVDSTGDNAGVDSTGDRTGVVDAGAGVDDARTQEAAMAADVTADRLVDAGDDDARARESEAGYDRRASAGKWHWSLRRIPLSVAGLLSDLWDRSHSVVVTSATLRVGDSFSYLIGRLGLGSVETRQLSSPFTDLDERHLVLLTDYLPAPRGQLMDRFTEIEASEIPRLCVASDGAAMVLMTARTRLEHVRDHARAHLAPLGIQLLAQGDESSAALVQRMKADPKASLLGLRSFWEGVDIPGDALRLLMIEKIPFDSIGDPVASARMDLIEQHGRDPFAEYLVPRAAIAFAQGVGRLIRTETDTGVTVVLDNRLRRPVPYADVMRRSLIGPPAIRSIDAPREGYQAIADHLGLDFDEQRIERIESIPVAGTLSQAALSVGDPESPLDDNEITRRLDIARDWLGFDEWRPGQLEVMTRLMRGEDVVAVLPTGSGKSVTYQIPALVSPGVTLVVSPLIALMRDQVDNLKARGVSEVAAVYAGVGQAEQQAILRAAANGHIKLLYVSPERLWSPVFRDGLKQVKLARIAVDEAHCISLWGHSFRPEYAIIPRAIEEISGERLPIAAVTATAAPRVLDDIAGLLRLRLRDGPLRGSVDRPEIRYYVERCNNNTERDMRVVQIVDAFKRQSAVVYVPTRKDTVRLAGLLRLFGHRVRPYSGAMQVSERQHTEDAFRHGEIDVVVATKAFGLGIDKPDIALVVHLEMPASIEEYVQETGRVARGAREGIGPETGTAVLLVKPRDCLIHDIFVRSATPDIGAVEDVWASLSPGMNFMDPDNLPPLRGTRSSDDADDDYRAETTALALHYLEQVRAVRRHPDFILQGRINAAHDSDSEGGERRSSAESPSEADGVVDKPDNLRGEQTATGGSLSDMSSTRLIRSAAAGEQTAGGGSLSELEDRLMRFAEQQGGEYASLAWCEQLQMTPMEIESVLFGLQHRDICDFKSWRYGWVYEILAGAAFDRDGLQELIDARRDAVSRRAKQAKDLAHGKPGCRRRAMLRYLGEPDPDVVNRQQCGACDSCTPDLPRPWTGLELEREHVAEALGEQAPALVWILVDSLGPGRWSRRNIVRTLRGQSGGKYPLDEKLRSHSVFGRLAILDAEAVEEIIDDQISLGYLCEVEELSDDGREYTTLRVTDEGRQVLSARYPR